MDAEQEREVHLTGIALDREGGKTLAVKNA